MLKGEAPATVCGRGGFPKLDLLAALALQVVHGVDRNRVVSDAVEIVHEHPLFPVAAGVASLFEVSTRS